MVTHTCQQSALYYAAIPLRWLTVKQLGPVCQELHLAFWLIPLAALSTCCRFCIYYIKWLQCHFLIVDF